MSEQKPQYFWKSPHTCINFSKILIDEFKFEKKDLLEFKFITKSIFKANGYTFWENDSIIFESASLVNRSQLLKE